MRISECRSEVTGPWYHKRGLEQAAVYREKAACPLGPCLHFFPIKIMVEPAHSPFALYPLKARIEKLWEASLAKQRSSPGGEAIIIFLYGTELAQSRSHGLMQISSVASDLFDR